MSSGKWTILTCVWHFVWPKGRRKKRGGSKLADADGRIGILYYIRQHIDSYLNNNYSFGRKPMYYRQLFV